MSTKGEPRRRQGGVARQRKTSDGSWWVILPDRYAQVGGLG